MDRTRAIDGLAAALRDAASRSDWELLGRAADELAPALRQLGAGRSWTGAEQAALGRLRSAHDGAAARVVAASVQLQARLDDMRVNKEGFMAYALTDEPDTGPQR